MINFLTIIIACLVTGIFNTGQVEEPWKKGLDKDNVTVYTRSVESSAFKEIRTEATMHGTVAEFRSVISDVSNYPDWMPDCKSVRVIGTPTQEEIIYRMELSVPFPVAKRDMVEQLLFTETRDGLEVSLVSCPICIEPEKGVVRIEVSYGKWIVKQLNPDEIFIQFQCFTDPGGDLPAWLVNSFIEKSPHTMMIQLREVLAAE